ncbi:MAG: Ig-like domain-containing protein [Candidatus Parcubacteria bacterium]|nr:Ig-like domain-containing protein [Candidatus Parcubacteria bacterium]
MAQKVKKQLFRILPLSVAGLMMLGLAVGFWTNLPQEQVEAAALSITITSVTLTLQTDSPVNGITNIGDTIRVDLDVSNADGGCTAVTTATANLTAYGGGAAVALSCLTDNAGLHDIMRLDFPVANAGGAGIDVGAANALSQVNVVTADADDIPGPNANSNSMASAVDTIAPILATSGLTISTDNGVPAVAAVNGGIVAADAVKVNATVTVGDTDIITWNASPLGGGASATQANNVAVTVAPGAVDNAAYAFNVTATDNAGNAVTTATNVIDATTISLDNIMPILATSGLTISTDNGVGGVAAVNGGIVAADAVDVNATSAVGDTDVITWDASPLGGGASATQANTVAVTVAPGAVDNAAYAFNVTDTDDAGNAVTTATNVIDATTISLDNIIPIVTVPGTINLTDVGGDGIASIGDTITYVIGTETIGDGASWTVDLLAYGLSATQAPGAVLIIADDDDNVAFSANETVTDDAGNTQSGAPTATVPDFANIDNVAPVAISAVIDMNDNVHTLTVVFIENMDTTQVVDATQLTLQDAATAGTSITLATSTAAYTGPATLVFTLSDADLNALKANGGLYTSLADSFVTITDGTLSNITDVAGNPMAAIVDGAGGQLTGYTADTTAPTVNAGSLMADESTCTGAGVCRLGDHILFTWDNTSAGDNPTGYNGDIASVIADLSPFGGNPAQVMYDDGTNGDVTTSDGLWTYDLLVAADDDEGTNTFDVTVTDNALVPNSTGPITSTDTAPVDNVEPILTFDSVYSDNAFDTTLAGVGKLVIVEFTPSETLLSQTVNFNNPAAGVVGAVDDGTGCDAVSGDLIWTACAPVTGTPPDTDAALADFTIDMTDSALNPASIASGTLGSSVTVDTTAPAITQIKALLQAGGNPVGVTNNWYYYAGQSIRFSVTSDQPLSALKACTQSLANDDRTDLCSVVGPNDFETGVPGTDYINFTNDLGANEYEFILPVATFGIPTLPGGYAMNLYLVDESGNVAFSTGSTDSFGAVFGINPVDLDPLLANPPSNTTDWSLITDFTDVPSLTFNANDGVNDLASITFINNVNLTDSATITALIDFGDNITINASDGSGTANVGINSAALADLDFAASISIMVPGGVQPGLVVYDNLGNISGYVSNTASGDGINDGTHILDNYAWDGTHLTFDTDGFSDFGADNTAPTALFSPANGATGVALSANVVITFDEPVNTGTFAYTLDNSTGISWDPTDTIATITHTAYAYNSTHTISVTVADDLVGNSLAAPLSATFTTTATLSGGGGGGGYTTPPVDATLPVGTSLVIAGGATQTSSQSVSLAIAATNAVQMAISNNADFSGGIWETYATSKTWTLSDNYGSKTVYAKFKNSTGSVSAALSDTINYVAVVTEEPVVTETPAVTIIDPSNLTSLLATYGLIENQSEEARYRILVLADAKEFGLTLTEAQLDAIVNFIVYGNSTATIKFGSGERRAIIRDYFETVVRADVVWSDIELMATGHKPIYRNLAKEQAQVGRVLATFKTMFGHAPNFKDAKDDLAWNTMMYRIRFARDLVKERLGILKFREMFGHSPVNPLAWSTVRAWGYIFAQ